MTPRALRALVIGALILLAIPIADSLMYTVNEQELAVLLQFGRPVASRTKPGLYFKLPFVQEVLRLPKTLQVWHGTRPSEWLVDVPTADGKKLEATVWAVWRITDPVQFVQTLRTVENGESRVKEFVRSTARDTLTTHNLAEIVRSSNRKMTYTLGLPPEMLAQVGGAGQDDRDTELPAGADSITEMIVPPEAREVIELGRLKIMDQIKETTQAALAQQGSSSGPAAGRGIELVDVGLSRVEFVPQVREAAFNRAIALMEAIAMKATSEGDQRKQEIINKAQAEVEKLQGEGKKEANILRGKVEAEIIDAFAQAIQESGDFYAFLRRLEIYKEALQDDTRLILTTDSDLFRMLKTLPKVEERPSGPSPNPAATAPSVASPAAAAGSAATPR